ncbi:hypothetical protein HOI26_01880 [Candidatus Woesearchaeota archaeon]|jgi:hypothetical protein|nr:hypothetical protein [Candidatus Woesearchaeota archaeon]MBT5739826.1 hypothetical protein [Candidatus Woesearchaeota archaeon]
MKNEAILSGYIRYRPVNKTYYLMVNSRRLCVSLVKQQVPKVIIEREKEFFIVKKNKNGNVLKPRNKELVTCISGNRLLREEEKEKLTGEDTKYSFPVKIKILPKDFGIDKYDLYPDEDAARLGRALSKRGIIIPSRIMTPKAFPHDLEFMKENYRIVVEITQTKPSEQNNLNFRHQPSGGSVRAHIFDIYRRCVNAALSEKNDIIGFVILHENWQKHNHIAKLVPELKKVKCYILFTDFTELWEEKSTNQMLERLQDE